MNFLLNKDLQRVSLEIDKILNEKRRNSPKNNSKPLSFLNEDLRGLLNHVVVKHDAEFNLTVIPWLTEEEIEFLQDISNKEIKKFVEGYEINGYSKVPYFDFQQDIERQLKFKFMLDLSSIIEQIYDIVIEEVNSVHLSRYFEKSYNKNSWHIDRGSDITGVTILNDDFDGGNLELNTGGVFGKTKTFNYKDFQKGCIHIFPGEQKHHGTPVLKGDKKILTIWSKSKKIIQPSPFPSTRSLIESMKTHQNIL